jgi:hypothetical protein
MLHTKTQDVLFACPDKNVAVKIGLPQMTLQQFVHWRAFNRAAWVNCTACSKRHLVLSGDCFLQGEELRP